MLILLWWCCAEMGKQQLWQICVMLTFCLTLPWLDTIYIYKYIQVQPTQITNLCTLLLCVLMTAVLAIMKCTCLGLTCERVLQAQHPTIIVVTKQLNWPEWKARLPTGAAMQPAPWLWGRWGWQQVFPVASHPPMHTCGTKLRHDGSVLLMTTASIPSSSGMKFNPCTAHMKWTLSYDGSGRQESSHWDNIHRYVSDIRISVIVTVSSSTTFANVRCDSHMFRNKSHPYQCSSKVTSNYKNAVLLPLITKSALHTDFAQMIHDKQRNR